MSLKKTVTIRAVLLVLGLGLVSTLSYGLFSPFCCDVPVVNYLTCFLEREKRPEYTFEFDTNDAEETPQPTEQPPTAVPTVMHYEDIEKASVDDAELSSFLSSLKLSIESKDYKVLGELLSGNFNIGPYQGEYVVLNKDKAIQKLETELETNSSSLLVDTSNEGRQIAQELGVTPSQAVFAVMLYGMPKESFSILGISKVGEVYVWTDMVMFPR